MSDRKEGELPPRYDGVDPAPYSGFPRESSAQIYDSVWCGLRRDQIRLPDGKQQDYHVFEVTNAVVVVPVLSDGSLLMIWQYRYPHGRTHWEVPAGRMKSEESPLVAAHRELREETGFTSERVEELCGFYPINGISDHFAHAFVAHDCEHRGAPDLDDSELLEVRRFPRGRFESCSPAARSSTASPPSRSTPTSPARGSSAQRVACVESRPNSIARSR